MLRHVKALAVMVALLVIPTAAYAQASIVVTVKAASPALIEKTRSVVTNSVGHYSIEDLRPGTYVVSFSLTGFATVKREGIELTGSFIETVNADMKVGGV